VQNITKGRLLIAVLVLTSGFLGGVLGVYLGRSTLEVIILAAVFGFIAYLVLIALVMLMMFTAIKTIERMHNEH